MYMSDPANDAKEIFFFNAVQHLNQNKSESVIHTLQLYRMQLAF